MCNSRMSQHLLFVIIIIFYRGDGGWLQFVFKTEKDLCSACAAVGVKSLARSHFRLCVPINPSNSEAATASLGC